MGVVGSSRGGAGSSFVWRSLKGRPMYRIEVDYGNAAYGVKDALAPQRG